MINRSWLNGTDIDYATRIAHLTSGGGLNVTTSGNILLKLSTIHSNGLADKLYGGAGMDRFFAGMQDLLFNQKTGEVTTQI